MILAKARKKLPVRLRQNWKVLTLTGVGVLVAVTVFGDVVLKPYSASTAAVSDEEQITQDITGSVDLFDDDSAHEITLSYSQADYDEMLDAYFADGEKEWMVADITIDGTTIDDVGIRLKGNSTLSSLVDDREGSATYGESAPGGIGGMNAEGGGFPGGGEMPEGMTPPEGMEFPEGMTPPEGMEFPTDGQMPEGMGEGGFTIGAALSTDEPENLPLLVSFDEYDEGRAYQGLTELSIRPSSSSYESALNEAVSLELTAQAGQTTQDYAYTTYTVNDRPTTTRLVVESPDAQYATDLDGDGVLFKVLSTSSFTYQGDDQTEYADDFKQVNLVGSQDLQPIISFLKWLDEASDEEFADDLDQWIDVDSLAKYLALQDVIGNTDTLSGPGRNGYLYYDLDTGLISVISWDLNLAMGGMTMGAQGRAPGADTEDGDAAPGDAEMPALPNGGEMPTGGMMGSGNELLSRFQESDAFAAMIDAATADLQATLIERGRASDIVDRIVARIPVTDGVTQEAIDTDADTARQFFASE